MGRPKGSKNKTAKRKYIRRKPPVPAHVSNGAEGEAKQLVGEIKAKLLTVQPVVAKLAIEQLILDLDLVNKIVGGLPPAP